MCEHISCKRHLLFRKIAQNYNQALHRIVQNSRIYIFCGEGGREPNHTSPPSSQTTPLPPLSRPHIWSLSSVKNLLLPYFHKITPFKHYHNQLQSFYLLLYFYCKSVKRFNVLNNKNIQTIPMVHFCLIPYSHYKMHEHI